MIDPAALEYKIYNPEKRDCPVSRLFNNLYKSNMFQSEHLVPKELGEGYGKRYVLNSSMEIFISDITFYENLTMREEINTSPHYGLSFCLEDPLHWWKDDNKKEYEIGCGESYIFNGLSGSNSCIYFAGKRFFGVSLRYDPKVIQDLVTHFGKGTAVREYNECQFYARKFSPNIKLILNDMIRCQYCRDIKKIYLEGKSLELLAVYLDELILENGKTDALPKLSSADMDALYHARKILDDNFISAPTIAQLSKLTCLNEYKLKAGFREMFGMPIHTYVIDKRLELARLLIGDRKISVVEAALLVGYSNTNYFTEKFKAKYGVKPSECKKLL
ncbi:MAG: AraC family transcriptional regulator [Lacrimispora sp.]